MVSLFKRHSTILTGQGFVPKEQEDSSGLAVYMVGSHVERFGLSWE